jgi:hypothetical protein
MRRPLMDRRSRPSRGLAVDAAANGFKLRQMKLFRSCLTLLTIVLVGACNRDKTVAVTDSARASGPRAVDSAIAASRAQHWDSSAGPVLLVMADTPSKGYILVPDSSDAAAELAAIPHPASVTLFGRGGTVQTAELPAIDPGGSCPAATLRAAPPPRAWSVGFIGGVVSPLGMDSTESLSHADSATTVISATRLASALPNDSAGRFTGLPFVVHAVWRFTLPAGTEVFVANLVRQINQEATPLQERTMIIAERAPTDSVPTMVYSERSYGDEETIESREVLAAALLGEQRSAALVLVRDYGESTAYALLERTSPAHWEIRWTSPRRRC